VINPLLFPLSFCVFFPTYIAIPGRPFLFFPFHRATDERDSPSTASEAYAHSYRAPPLFFDWRARRPRGSPLLSLLLLRRSRVFFFFFFQTSSSMLLVSRELPPSLVFQATNFPILLFPSPECLRETHYVPLSLSNRDFSLLFTLRRSFLHFFQRLNSHVLLFFFHLFFSRLSK